MTNFKMTSDLFAIRHVPTHQYMPQLDRRGYSLLEVEDFKTAPRLFWTRIGAARALRSWLKGPLHKSRSYQDSFTGEWEIGGGGDPISKTPPANRVGADMEIVRFKLEELGLG